VASFLKNAAAFLDIPKIVEYVLSKNWKGGKFDLESVLDADHTARLSAGEYITKLME
jgi:1-deoxy-D-xylulose 5-phosphate reductoisomerase